MMRDVFICDAVRTPIGRYGGALAKVRTDDLAAAPAEGADEAQSEGGLGQARRGLSRLRQPGRRGQPQRRPHGAAARRTAGIDAGRDAQSALRVGPRCGRQRGARDQGGRDRFRDRGRRRVDDARPVRDGQGAGAVPAQRRDLRHDDRLALHQSGDQGAIRRRCHAGDRRERRRGIPGDARRPGCVRAALAAARRQGDRGRLFRRRDCAGRNARRQGRPDHRRQGRASAPGDDGRAACQAEDAVPHARHRDGGQCFRRQRRRRRAHPRLRRSGEGSTG